MEFLELHKVYPSLQIDQDLVTAAVAELIAFTKERLFDLITDDRLLMYVHEVIGEKHLSSAVIQRTIRCMEENDHAFIKRWKAPAEHHEVWVAGHVIRQMEQSIWPHVLEACGLSLKSEDVPNMNLVLLQYQLGDKNQLTTLFYKLTGRIVDNDRLLTFARHQEDFALPYWRAATQEAKRCATFWKTHLDTIMKRE